MERFILTKEQLEEYVKWVKKLRLAWFKYSGGMSFDEFELDFSNPCPIQAKEIPSDSDIEKMYPVSLEKGLTSRGLVNTSKQSAAKQMRDLLIQ